MMHKFNALRTRTWFAISLILGFALVTFGCDTSSSKPASSTSRQSMNIGIKADAVPEGISITFDYIPQEATRLFIHITEWYRNKEISGSHDIVMSYADIRDSILEQVKNSGKVIFPFVKAGQEYRVAVTFEKEEFKPIENILEWVYAECIPYSGIFFNEDIKLNLNDTFTGVTLSSEPIFSGEVRYSTPKYSISVSLDTVNIGVGGFTNTLSENILTMYFEPEMSDDLKKSGLLENGDYPAYIRAYCNLIYDNIKWEVEIAKTPVFTYSF